MISNVQAFLCLLMATVSFGMFPSPYNVYNVGPSANAPHICPLPSLPCRIRVNLKLQNSTSPRRIQTPICQCNGAASCPTDWSNTQHVVSRRLITAEQRMTLQMMFCQEVTPKNLCAGPDPITGKPKIALVVSGHLSYPTNILSYNCRCRGQRAMVLHERRGVNHPIYGMIQQHSYVCAYDKPSCPNPSSHCMVLRDESTDYTCKCPRGTHCQVPPESLATSYDPLAPKFGYCRPRSAWP